MAKRVRQPATRHVEHHAELVVRLGDLAGGQWQERVLQLRPLLVVEDRLLELLGLERNVAEGNVGLGELELERVGGALGGGARVLVVDAARDFEDLPGGVEVVLGLAFVLVVFLLRALGSVCSSNFLRCLCEEVYSAVLVFAVAGKRKEGAAFPGGGRWGMIGSARRA